MPSNKPFEKAKVARAPLVYRAHVYNPYVKNILIGGGLMVLGEICAQSIKMVYSPSEPNEHKTASSSDKDFVMEAKKVRKSWLEIVRSYDPKMIARQGAIGSFQGLYQYIYYSWLDKVLVGASLSVVVKKVLLDELFLGPISLVIFFTYNGFCDTFTVAGAMDRCYHSFIPGYLSDLAFWPLLQSINFAFVPTAYRVLYVAFFTSIWNTYLCFFNARMSANASQHNEDKEENSQLQKIK
ncbi:unnamed protein product [Trichobilharzia szidati]|nr:unnamed protein product [Trichobilharzia szidati]